MKKSFSKKNVVLSTIATLMFTASSAIAVDGSGSGEDQPSATSDTDRVNNYDTVSSPRWRRNTTTQGTQRSTTSGRAMRPIPSSGETVLDSGSEGVPRSTGGMIDRGPSTSGVPANGTSPGTPR